MRLTDLTLKSLQPPEKGARIYYDDSLKGFGVRVSQAGTKAFILSMGRNRDRQTLGRYPIISLSEARTAAKRILAERTLGKHHTAPRTRFSEALELFLKEKEAKCRPVTMREYRAILGKQFRRLHDRSLEDIRPGDITRVTDQMLADGRASYANHALTSCRTFFAWCARRGYLHQSPVGHLERPSRLVAREHVLTDEELRAVWQAAEATPTNFGRIVQILILTGVRRLEATHLRLEGAVAILAAQYSKNRREHRFPISERARAILEANPDLSWGGWSKAKLQLNEKVAKILGRPCEFRLHDLRRTAATNWQKHCGALTEDVEALLGHVTFKTGLIGTYQRWDRWPRLEAIVETYDRWFREDLHQNNRTAR